MRKKLFLTYLAVILTTLSIAAYLFWSNGYWLMKMQSEAYFLIQAKLLRDVVEQDATGNDDYQVLIQQYAEEFDIRITLIGQDGTVIADSISDTHIFDNHINREEVTKALNGENGVAIRRSDTQHKEMLYAAVPIDNPEIKVLRIATQLEGLDLVEIQMIKTITTTLVISTMIALGISLVFTTFIIKPINQLIEGVDEIANGNYDKKIYIHQKDQIGKLASVFNSMSMVLKVNIQKLVQRKSQLESILKSMSSGIVAVDEGNLILFHNQIFVQLFELKEERVAKKSLYNVVRNSLLYQVIDSVRDTGDEVVLEGRLSLNDEKIIRIYGTPIKQEDEKIIGVLIVIEDITKIRKLENMRSSFVSNVTHELKTPLTSIRGFVDTLRNGAIKDEKVANRFLEIIDIEAERLYTLIQDILLLSEIESKEDYNIRTCNIHKLTLEVGELLRYKLQQGVALNIEIKKDLAYECNEDRIKQLLINLIENAMKHTDKGEIYVRGYKRQESLYIEVADTGIGIQPEHLERIFQRFYRVDQGRSRKVGGTGLGLSIVKHIAELYDGSVTVQSIPNQGTTFTVRLPYTH